jgi:SAM-dependent methyltransferase
MPVYTVQTDFPIAVDSNDHKVPGGTRHDNSREQKFNDRLYPLLADLGFTAPYCGADLGCAGGGFVKSVIEDGHDAIGLEGSDYSLIRKRAEWATIPDRLFTCDITKFFQVYKDGQPARFDFLTSWECLEHLEEKDLPSFCANLIAHLAPNGIFCASISRQHGFHHRTVQNATWWKRMFVENGFRLRDDLLGRFEGHFVRSEANGAPDSFHVILQAAPKEE